jgi:hypothetical protein
VARKSVDRTIVSNIRRKKQFSQFALGDLKALIDDMEI